MSKNRQKNGFCFGQNSVFEPVFTFFQKNRVVSQKDSSNKHISWRNKKVGQNWPKIKCQSHQRHTVFFSQSEFAHTYLPLLPRNFPFFFFRASGKKKRNKKTKKNRTPKLFLFYQQRKKSLQLHPKNDSWCLCEVSLLPHFQSMTTSKLI